MKLIGYLLITVGFLAGAYLTVLDTQMIQWGNFIMTLAIGFLGVALVQIGSRKLSTAEDKVADNISIIESSLSNLVEKVTQLNADKASIDTYEMRHKLDELLLDDLDNFAEARQTIAHVYSLQSYAEVMSNFAGGERYLNRVWSASADGYIDEVNQYIEKAQEQFAEAQQKLRGAKEQSETMRAAG
ncbi:MAG: hypothetical protein GWO08_15090 [Gammaproteobacteria bacterium]|nr:hypothetical protein [Gammaproteobacteria bacterium]NIX56914.1 hypothetical protein [candidate division Zixibacteria bacterium]